MYEVYTRNVDMPPHPTPPQPNLRNCVFQKRAFYEHGFRSAGKIMYNVASVWRQALLWAHHASGAVPCLCSRTVQWPSVWPRTTPTLLSAMICHGIYENANLCIASIWCYMMLYVSICHIHSYSSCQNYQLFFNNMPNISKYSNNSIIILNMSKYSKCATAKACLGDFAPEKRHGRTFCCQRRLDGQVTGSQCWHRLLQDLPERDRKIQRSTKITQLRRPNTFKYSIDHKHASTCIDMHGMRHVHLRVLLGQDLDAFQEGHLSLRNDK